MTGQGVRKGVFRLVYMALTVVTLWKLGSYMINRIGDSDRLIAFVSGQENIDSIKVVMAAFVCSLLLCIAVLYIILEAFEEGILDNAHAKWPNGRNKGFLFLDFITRLLAVGLLVLGPKFLELESYVQAMKFVSVLCGAYTIWLVVVRLCYGVWRRNEIIFAPTMTVACYGGSFYSERMAGWELLAVLVMVALVISVSGFAFGLIKRDGRRLLTAAAGFFADFRQAKRMPTPPFTGTAEETGVS